MILKIWQNTCPSNRFRIVGLVITATVVIGWGIVGMDLGQARVIQAYWGYYLCATVVLTSAVAVWADRRRWSSDLLPDKRRTCRMALACALLGTCITLLHEPFAMRVFNDEPNHVIVSQSMATSRGVYSAKSGYYESGSYLLGGVNPFYRMYLYPFLLSGLHNTTGLRVENAFILNSAITFGTFVLVFLIGRKITGGRDLGGYAGQVLLLGSPLFAQTSNSAAYDPANLLALAAFMLACLLYARRPGIQDGMSVCLSLGLLLSYGRSESVIFMIVFAGLYGFKCLRCGRIELTWWTVVSPILLIGPLAARKIGENFGQKFDTLYDVETTGWLDPTFFTNNVRDSFNWMFSLNSADLNHWWLSALFAVIPILGIFVSLRLARRRRSGPRGQIPDRDEDVGFVGKIWLSIRGESRFVGVRKPTLNPIESNSPMRVDLSTKPNRGNENVAIVPDTLSAGGVGILFMTTLLMQLSLVMAQFWSPIEASAVRFFLPSTLFMIVSVVWAAAAVGNAFPKVGPDRILRFLILTGLLFFWSVTLPKAARAETTHTSLPGSYGRQSLEWALRHDDASTLYAVRNIDYFALHQLPAVSLNFASQNYPFLDALVAEGLYSRVLVLDYTFFDPDHLEWLDSKPRLPIPPEMVFETLDRYRGFLYAERTVRQLVGWRSTDGTIIPLGAMKSETLPRSSADAYFQRLQIWRGNHRNSPDEE